MTGTGLGAGGDGAVQAWAAELDAMEAHLADQRAAFASRGAAAPAVRHPTPLEELGPLPEELRGRAEALLAATRALEGSVAEARASLVAAVRSAERTGRRAAAFVDAQA
ncbi:MAG: hypothetical protein ACP5P9_05105 [Acidimicrobiales bacterium]